MDSWIFEESSDARANLVDSMGDVVDEKTLLECFCDPESTDTDEERALRLLSRYPYPEQVRKIRDLEVSRYSDHYQSSLLHYACRNGWYDVSRELVDKYQCDPHLKNEWEYTPLHCACEGGSIDIVRFLIVDHHCDPACHGLWGRTPLHIVCRNGKLDIVKFLVGECHCDPRVKYKDGKTPLHCACEGGSIDIVRFLIVDHRCDPACREGEGITPLHHACKSGKLDIVKFLVAECHCDPRVKDRGGDTPLHWACEEGSTDIVRFLIVDHHCDPACRGRWGRTPLHYVCKSGKLDIVRFLVEECHCDPGVKDRGGDTPLHYACKGGRSIDIVWFLIVDHHCDPACCGEWGRTPLHWACESGNLYFVKFLVEDCHCDPRVKGESGLTPLHYACCEGGSIDIVKFLIVDHHCDPTCCGELGRTPLHCACESEDLDFVKFLVEECHCDPRVKDMFGNTPLHWACEGGSIDIVKFLVEECHGDPFRRKDYYGHTPLHLAAREEHDDVLVFLLSHIPPLKLVNSVIKLDWHNTTTKLLQAFIKCRTEYPLESAFKIFVLGNHAAGKSTLVKVIENKITSFFSSFAGQFRKVSESAVVPLTAGIIPVSIESQRLGQIVIYDMAGQYQYYSSHATLLRSLVSSSTSMFLVVVSLNQEKEEIFRQLQYWNSFIDNCCSSAGRPLTVVVFSHADEVVEDKPERKSSEIVKELAHSEPSSSFSEVVTLDCRKLASGGLTKISKIVAGCCAKFRQTFQFDFAVHLLYAFISSRLADQIAYTVSELQSLIKQEQSEDSFALKIKRRRDHYCVPLIKEKEILPTNATELSNHLTTLSDKGRFLFLRNAKKVEDSWVVIDKAVLLSEVNGTIFAPDNFKQHHKIANSTGVVPFSKIREAFPERDPDMVVDFLQHLEFCQEISEAEVSLISREHFRCSCPVERFFFFPALVSEERPSGASEAIDTPSYRCGWTLQCSRPHQFLTPQFLHVLLLRLAFSFALAHDDDDAHKTIPVLERMCFVWKNGIYWLWNGIKTTVEVIEQNTAVLLTISCHTKREMKCVEHRSQVIKCILETKKELCPAVTMKESLIHPSCLTTPVTGTLFSLSQLVRALLNNELELVSQSGEVSVEIDQLLYFEPYTCFSADVLRELVDKSENNSDEHVPEAFLNAASKTFHAKMDQCKRDQPEYQCKLVFQVWKESTQSPTYGALRSALDKYSVFCGRNPLVSCTRVYLRKWMIVSCARPQEVGDKCPTIFGNVSLYSCMCSM